MKKIILALSLFMALGAWAGEPTAEELASRGYREDSLSTEEATTLQRIRSTSGHIRSFVTHMTPGMFTSQKAVTFTCPDGEVLIFDQIPGSDGADHWFGKARTGTGSMVISINPDGYVNGGIVSTPGHVWKIGYLSPAAQAVLESIPREVD